MTESKLYAYLKDIYYTPSHPAAFGSMKILYNNAKKRFKNVKQKDIKYFLSKQTTYTLHKPVTRVRNFRKTIAAGINSIHQADLVDVHNIARENNNFRFLLTNIDVFSRKAHAVPIKRKTAEHVIDGFRKIHKKMGYPLKLHTDKGKEFVAKRVQEYFKSFGIEHYTTASDKKAAICERFNKTLRRLIFLYFTANKTLKYTHVLDDLLKTYNNRYHSALGRAPNQVTSRNEQEVWNKQYSDAKELRNKKFAYKIGDQVRINKYKGIFKKGHLPQWTDEIFTVVDTLNTVPPTYRIQDKKFQLIEGIFYKNELQKVTIPQV